MHHHHRRSIRLQGYDYTQNGAYFVTICAYRRICLFGKVVDHQMVCNAWGRIAQSCWDAIPNHHTMVELDAFVVMPNYIHGLIVINADDHDRTGMIYHAPTDHAPTHHAPAPQFSKPIANSLSTVIGTYKAAVTRNINRLPDAPDHPVWQRNYYEHIIRNHESLHTIRAYVAHNPARWTEDSLFAS